MLVLPSLERPVLAVPLDAPRVATYALEHWTVPRGRYRTLRRRVVQGLIARRALPPVGRSIALAQRRPAPPFLVAATSGLGLPTSLSYFLRLPEGDSLARGPFFLLEEGAGVPHWILKFARVPGYREPFDREERGLAIAAESGVVKEGRSPTPVGRLEVAGLHAAVETAATGSPLGDLLAGERPLAHNLADVERVADWIVRLGMRTRHAGGISPAEREQIAAQAAGMPGANGIDSTLASVPAVTDHNDLGPWNVIVDGKDFVVVDWESARRAAPPLWDLWYFLAEAAATLDGVPHADRGEHLVRLFRGDTRFSSLLFRWTSRAVGALAVPPDAVSLLAMLCWVHHAQSHEKRTRALDRHVGSTAGEDLFTREFPGAWLTDPALGANWNRWRSSP